jgi:hypothetical protein
LKLRIAFRIAAITVSLAFMLLMGEIGVRLLDGYALWPPTLSVRTPATPAPVPAAASGTDVQLASRYAGEVALAPLVEQAWYQEDPSPVAPYPTPPWITSRLEQPGNETRLFEFNRAFLQDRLCGDVATSMFGSQQDFLYFDPVGPDIYPSYRHLRRLSAPGWFTTNSFGYRGPDLALDKPAGTIRIAFVGASTTIGAFDFPFSFPELIGHWLDRWASATGRPYKFEVINSARTGIDSHSVAAIVRDELLPLEPDLVVSYAANQFWPQESIGYRLGRLYQRPTDAAAARRVSALALRFRQLLDSWRGGDGGEPAKPIQWIRMPGVDEQNPDSRDKNLPAQLPVLLADLDSIHGALSGVGSELVVTSFMWMAKDGLKLDLPRQLRLFNHLNNDYWPATYDTMRRLADLQNRAYLDFARRHGVPFFDIASRFPLDPDLFADAVHLGYPGTRLKAWMIFQDLARLIDERISSGKLPRPMTHPGRRHPAFDQPSPRTITRAAVLASCQR